MPVVPVRLGKLWGATSAGRVWLDGLSSTIAALSERWDLALDSPFDDEDVRCSWVAPALRSDGTPVVLKIPMRHFEADHEIDGLRFWGGNPTIRLLDEDEASGGMLLERCRPGTSLRSRPEAEQDAVIAGLLRRLWRQPGHPHPFRPLSGMLQHWIEESLARRAQWVDRNLTEAGLQLFRELSAPTAHDVLLATDLHAGNVLRAEREQWLVIDPKPFIGDPAYDTTQHLVNCRERLVADAEGTIRRFAELVELDYHRVRLWVFARLATELGPESVESELALARGLAP